MKTFLGVLAAGVFFFLFSCESVDPLKKYPNMVANADPVSAGTITVQFDRFLSSKLSKNEIEVIFYPRLNAVALEFKYELITNRQFWDEASRIKFAEALNHYKTDYAERSLIDKYRKTRAVYGKVNGRTEWESFKFAKTRVAYPVIELGYRFRDEMPFFSTLMRSSKEIDENSDNSSLTDSQQIPMYFTRAQADDLVKLFDQSYLVGLLNLKDEPQPAPGEEGDNYREFNDYR